MNKSLILADAVEAGYGETTVISNVTLGVQPGERWALVGPNGSGKTTFLRVLGRVLPVRRGEVLFDGRPLPAWTGRALARRIGYVPAETAIEFDYTAREIMLMGRAPHLGFLEMERPSDLAIAREAARLCDCESYQDRPATLLSSGERQRVIIARALAQVLDGADTEPRALLLDEPTSHLDLAHAAGILDLLARLARERRIAVVAVFHDLTQAASWCDKMLLLDGGSVAEMGLSEEVLQPRVLEKTYGIRMRVATHPVTGRPLVVAG